MYPGAALAVPGDHDKGVRPQSLCQDLVFHVGFGRQEQELGGPQVEDGHVELGARVGPLAPAQAQRRQALAEGLRVRGQPLRQVGDRETGAVARLEAQGHRPEAHCRQRRRLVAFHASAMAL